MDGQFSTTSLLNYPRQSQKVISSPVISLTYLEARPNFEAIKRTHEQMIAPSRWNNPEPSSYSDPRSPFLPDFNNLQMDRFVGDGFDYRRPVTTHANPNVIDLTEDPATPRLPPPPARGHTSTSTSRRSGRPENPVIDLDEEYENDEREVQIERVRDASPEFEVLYSRPRSAARPRSQSAGSAARRDGSHSRRAVRPTPQLSIQRSMADLQRGLQEATNRIGLYQSMLRPPARAPGHHHHHHEGRPHHQARHRVPNDADMLYFQEVGLDFHLPDQLDFESQGFRMGDARPQPPPPTYEPPPKARPGYTRSPKEDDVLICPNCNCELGVGRDDVKRQVWVVKKCGHVSSVYTSILLDTNFVSRSTVVRARRTGPRPGVRDHGQPAHSRSKLAKWMRASRKPVMAQR